MTFQGVAKVAAVVQNHPRSGHEGHCTHSHPTQHDLASQGASRYVPQRNLTATEQEGRGTSTTMPSMACLCQVRSTRQTYLPSRQGVRQENCINWLLALLLFFPNSAAKSCTSRRHPSTRAWPLWCSRKH